MTSTAHALVSGAIAAAVPNPVLSMPLIFVSHFIMDAVPHWDFGTDWRSRSKLTTGAIAICDTILGFTVAYFMFAWKVDVLVLLAAVFIGNLPDWLEAPYYIFFAKNYVKGVKKRAGFWEKLTYRIYKTENIFHNKIDFPLGIYTQIVTVAFFLLLLSFNS
jgi:hypothetical protein